MKNIKSNYLISKLTGNYAHCGGGYNENITNPLPSFKKNGFTLIELLVVISIVALLIAILLPALKKARESANTVQCLMNQRQIGVALSSYENQFGGMWPAPKLTNNFSLFSRDGKFTYSMGFNQYWDTNALFPYVKGKSSPTNATDNNQNNDLYLNAMLSGKTIFNCPSWRKTATTSDPVDVNDVHDRGYGMNTQLAARGGAASIIGSTGNSALNSSNGYKAFAAVYKNPSSFRKPSVESAVLDYGIKGDFLVRVDGIESTGNSLYSFVYSKGGGDRHSGNVNVLYADGHASGIDALSIPFSNRNTYSINGYAAPFWGRY